MFEARIATRAFGSFDSSAMLEDKRRQHHTDIPDVKTESEKVDVQIEGGSMA